MAYPRLVPHASHQLARRTVEYPLGSKRGRQGRNHQCERPQGTQEALAFQRITHEHECDPQTGSEALRQCGDVIHVFWRECGYRRWWRLGQQPVRVVFNDAQAAALCYNGQLFAPFSRHGNGRWVLQRRVEVDKPRSMLSNGFLQDTPSVRLG